MPNGSAATSWSAPKRLLASGDDPREVLEALSRALANKLLHAPTHALNHASGEDRAQLEALLRRLYHIAPRIMTSFP